MSNLYNDLVYDRATDMLEQWDGSVIAEMIQADLDRNDLDSLYIHICKAEAMTAQEEFEAIN